MSLKSEHSVSDPLSIYPLGLLDLLPQSNDAFQFLLLNFGWLVHSTVQEVIILLFTSPHLYVAGRGFNLHWRWGLFRGGKPHFLLVKFIPIYQYQIKSVIYKYGVSFWKVNTDFIYKDNLVFFSLDLYKGMELISRAAYF